MSLIQYIFWVMAAQASFICSVFWAMKCLVYLSVLVIMYQLMKKKWLMKKQVSESFLWQLHQSRQLMRGTFLFITMLKKQSLHKTDTTCHWYSIFLEWWLHKPVPFAVFSAHFRWSVRAYNLLRLWWSTQFQWVTWWSWFYHQTWYVTRPYGL